MCSVSINCTYDTNKLSRHNYKWKYEADWSSTCRKLDISLKLSDNYYRDDCMINRRPRAAAVQVHTDRLTDCTVR